MIVKHEANGCFPGAIGVGETYLMMDQGIPVQSFSHHVFVVH